jgi:hypothetical protein
VIAFANQTADPASAIPSSASNFSPAPEAIDAIIGALLNPSLKFGDIAAIHGTTVDALSAFLARPDIKKRLDDLESALAESARVTASHYLASVADTTKNFF